MSHYSDFAVIVLAAGKGTRMKSDLAKVLHKVAGKSMVVHVVGCATQIVGENIYVVIGHQAEKVKTEVNSYFDVHYAVQKDLLGTGDAVKSALPRLPEKIKNVLVLCGDVPLIKVQTLERLIQGHEHSKAKVTVLATDVEDPTGYGRLILDKQGGLVCIREEADAAEEEKKIQKINTGIYCFDRETLESAIQDLRPDNNQEEYYLTDVVALAKQRKLKIGVITMDDPRQVIGVNTLAELGLAERLIQQLEG